MLNDRLTIAAAHPGMKVRCVNPWPPLKYMQTYTIAAAYNASMALELCEHPGRTFSTLRFVPADDLPTLAALLAERTDGRDVLAGLRRWHSERAYYGARGKLSGESQDLYEAIERAGLIAQEPRTTEREATIREGWWA